MPRGKRNGAAPVEAVEQRAVEAASNVPDATAKKHFSKIFALETKLASVRQELTTAWANAEGDGIERKPFKAAMKLVNGDPATADAYMRKLNEYTTQLGLFDRIDAWKQGEQHEANAASVRAAEKAAKAPKASEAFEEPKSGGTLEAAYAQGFEAGEGGKTTLHSNPYNGGPADRADAWERGHIAGAHKRVDAANSAKALADAPQSRTDVLATGGAAA